MNATSNGNQGWTLHTFQIHIAALQAAEEKFAAERDRRYSETKVAEEKALQIQKEADRAALALAREIQSYKDEKANQLREQISSERGTFATQQDLSAAVRELNALITPILDYMRRQQGEAVGASQSIGRLISVVAVLAGLSTLGTFVVGMLLLFRN
jgi:hypothetical protein